MKQQRNKSFVFLPDTMLNNRVLSRTDLLLYAAIRGFADGKTACFASNSWFAERFGVSKSTVSHSLQKLEQMGLIRRTTLPQAGNVRILEARAAPETPENECLCRISSDLP